MEFEKARQIAAEIRKDFENGKIDERILRDLYQKYNPLEDVVSFVARANVMFPCLNCGLASIYLRDLLKCGRVVNGKFEDNDHTFLLLNEEVVVDITADQYNGPKVYVGPLRTPWSIK